jgi:hypothetical protein
MPIKINESEKKLYIFNIYKRFLFRDDFNFNKIYTNVVNWDDQTQIQNFGFIKFAFIHVEL